MSKQSRSELTAAIAAAVIRFQDATDRVDAAAADALGVNRTDLLCIGLLLRGGGMTAGELATAAGLSPAATTAAIERLEAAGYAGRTRDEVDRRRVLVHPTPLAEERTHQLYDPLRPAGTARLNRYNRAELELIMDFLEQGEKLQNQQAERIRALEQ